MFSEKTTTVTLHSYDELGRYSCSFEYLWVVGTGIAANSTLISPPQELPNLVRVWEKEKWVYKENHLGKVAYSVEDKSKIVIENLGSVPYGYTLDTPQPFDTWDGEKWEDQRTHKEKVAAKTNTLKPLSRKQFKLVLLDAGLLDDLELSISNIENALEKKRIEIEYTESTEFARTSESVKTMFALINHTEEQINELWEKALAL